IRHAMQPAGYGTLPSCGSGFVGQNEKARLKDILRVLIVPEEAPAHAQDQGAVAPHQARKRRFVALAGKALQELPVAPLLARRGGEHPFDMSNRGFQGSVRHGWSPPTSIGYLL